jgi:hypothetical protein
MKLRVALLTGIVTLVALSAWLARPAPISIASDFDAALATAKASGAWIVVHVRRADRPLGAKMDQETLADPEVARRAKDGFVHARLDAIAQEERLERLAGPGVALATLVVDESVEVVAELDGFADGTGLLAFLDKVRAQRPALSDPATPRVVRAETLFALGAVTSAEREVAAIGTGAKGGNGGDGSDAGDPALAARAAILRGRLELHRGHIAAAREALRETVARYPATPSARDATALLDSISSR